MERKNKSNSVVLEIAPVASKENLVRKVAARRKRLIKDLLIPNSLCKQAVDKKNKKLLLKNHKKLLQFFSC